MASRSPISPRQVAAREWQRKPSLRRALLSAYSLKKADERQMLKTLEKRGLVSYHKTLKALLKEVGCSQTIRKRDTEPEIHKQAKDAAKSIVATYNTELRNQINRVIAQGFGKKSEVTRTMNAWQKRRNKHKNRLILTDIRGFSSERARAVFWRKNKLLQGSKFIWDASPPIVVNSHKTCIRRVKQGQVAWKIARRWRRTHPN